MRGRDVGRGLSTYRHVPVAARCHRRCSRPPWTAEGAVVVDATLGLGGHAEALLEACPRPVPGRHRPRPAGARRSPASGSPASANGSAWCTRCTTRSPQVLAGLGLAARARRAVRPRRLVAAARRARARIRLRPGRPAGHADGPDRRASPPPRSLNTYPPATSPASCASTARSGSPGGSPRRWSASASAPRSPRRAAGRPASGTPSPRPTRRTGGNPAKRTFQALRIEVNGELGVLRPGAARRARRAGRRAAAIVGAGLPLARGPHRQAGPRCGRGQHRARGSAGGTARACARPAPAHPGRRDRLGRRDHGQPAGGLGPAARGGEGPGRSGERGRDRSREIRRGCRMTQSTAVRTARATTRPRPGRPLVRRGLGCGRSRRPWGHGRGPGWSWAAWSCWRSVWSGCCCSTSVWRRGLSHGGSNSRRSNVSSSSGRHSSRTWPSRRRPRRWLARPPNSGWSRRRTRPSSDQGTDGSSGRRA